MRFNALAKKYKVCRHVVVFPIIRGMYIVKCKRITIKDHMTDKFWISPSEGSKKTRSYFCP